MNLITELQATLKNKDRLDGKINKCTFIVTVFNISFFVKNKKCKQKYQQCYLDIVDIVIYSDIKKLNMLSHNLITVYKTLGLIIIKSMLFSSVHAMYTTLEWTIYWAIT